MNLEFKIYAFLAFFMVLFYSIACIKYKLSDTCLKRNYYMENEDLYTVSILIGLVLSIMIIGRLFLILIIWWFDLSPFNPYEYFLNDN